MDEEALKSYCLSFSGAYEDHPWRDTVFKVKKKIFVFCHAGPREISATVKITPELRELWLQRDDTFIPSYVGRYGWCGIWITSNRAWSLAQEGIATSWQRVSGTRSRQ